MDSIERLKDCATKYYFKTGARPIVCRVSIVAVNQIYDWKSDSSKEEGGVKSSSRGSADGNWRMNRKFTTLTIEIPAIVDTVSKINCLK